MGIQAVILAAGMGTRLGRPHPKPLTALGDGHTIMTRQVQHLEATFGKRLRLTIVVGFKLEEIMAHVPHASFVYNELFDQTNTSKSLLKALRNSSEGGVLWLNGDVVFDPMLLDHLRPHLEADESFVAVDTSAVSDEEVKYTVDSSGYVDGLSKALVDGLGEAVGINYVSSRDKTSLIRRLEDVPDQEYFEGGIVLSIRNDGVRYRPVDISQFYAVEVDSQDDLARANRQITVHKV